MQRQLGTTTLRNAYQVEAMTMGDRIAVMDKASTTSWAAHRTL